jgi:peroxiredoxin
MIRLFSMIALALVLTLTPITAHTLCVKIGNPVPDVTLPSLKGNPVSLSSLKGKIILLAFWASWCPRCEEELTFLQGVYKTSPDITVVAINQESQNISRAHLERIQATLEDWKIARQGGDCPVGRGELLLGKPGHDRRGDPGDPFRKTAMRHGGIVTRRIGAGLVALFFLACLSWVATGEEMKALRPLIGKGEKAPVFTLDTLEGKSLTFRPKTGKPAVVVFWSAFCPLCREMAPGIRDIFRRYGDSIRFLGVNLDGNRFRNAVRSFVREYDWNIPLVLDDIRNDFFIASDPYGIMKTPTAIVVDGNGTVWGVYAAEKMTGLVRDFDRIASEIHEGSNMVKKPPARIPSG